MESERLFLWIGFNIFVLGMLALDLGVFHRKAHTISIKEASIWSVVWVCLAMIFNVGIYYAWGSEKALEFLTGYVIEKSLSVDKLFVFLMIFQYFSTPSQYQHRVLFWGILGALILRAVFIATGYALLSNFHWMIYVFGGFLVVTGIKMYLQGNENIEPEKNPVVRLFERLVPIIRKYDGQKFFIRREGKRLRYAFNAGAHRGRDHRCDFRHRFHSSDFRHYRRPLHHLYIERVRDSRPACPLLYACRRHGNVRVFENRSICCSLLCRRQNDAYRYLQDSHRRLIGGHRLRVAALDYCIMAHQAQKS